MTEAVRLIKIDIEGYEPYAVLGLASTIARSPEIALLTEFSPISMIDADSSAASYIESLLGFGLFPHRMSGNQLIPIDVDELLVNCSVLNSGDFASMRTRCIDRTSSEIFEIATQYAAKLGFRGPIIENLVFIRRNESSVA